MRYTGPKNKLSRREGLDLFGKGSKLKRLNVTPGFTAKKRQLKVSEYGKQLRSKQTAKRIYGVNERQFRNYVKKAFKIGGNPSDNILELLEKRLDNFIYRQGWTKTRAAARQAVNHGHVKVNQKIVTIPSYETKIGDKVEIDTRMLINKDLKSIVKIEILPIKENIIEPINTIDIIEFYSR